MHMTCYTLQIQSTKLFNCMFIKNKIKFTLYDNNHVLFIRVKFHFLFIIPNSKPIILKN